MRRAKIRAIHKTANLLGYNVSRRADYYSTLPNLSELAGTVDRWFKPSEIVGVRYDLPGMKNLFSSLHEKWHQEFSQVTGDYKKNLGVASGPDIPSSTR